MIRDISGKPPDFARLDDLDRALAEYALKLTTAPGSVQESEIDILKKAGLSDRAIHDACLVVAYFNYVNRIAEGLGVELESGLESGERV